MLLGLVAVPQVNAQDTITATSNPPPVAITTATQTNDRVDITLRSGEIYKRCKITRVEPDGITVVYAKGVAKLPFANLPDEYQAKYHFDPTKATSYARTVATQQAQAFAKQQQDIQRQQVEARQQEQNKIAMKNASEAKAKALKILMQRIQSRQATTADCRVLIGCTKETVRDTLGVPPRTLASGSVWPYDGFIDPESGNYESITIGFEEGIVSTVNW